MGDKKRHSGAATRQNSHPQDHRRAFSLPKNTLPLILLFGLIAGFRLTQTGLSHGDEWGDATTMNAGENFAHLGFGPSHGLSVHWPHATQVPPAFRPDSPQYSELDTWNTNTRVPPLHNWINGVLQPVLGSSLVPYRLIAIGVSAIAVGAFYCFILWMTQSARVAGISSLLYVANPYFIANFDNINHLAYMDAFRNLALAGLAWMLFHRLNTKAWTATWLALFLLSLSVYYYLPWLTFFITSAAVYRAWKVNWRSGLVILFLGTAIAAGLLLHFGLVAWHYGSLQEALNDRLANAAQRMGGDETLSAISGGLKFSWANWLDIVALRFPLQVAVIPWIWLGFLAIASSIAWNFLTPDEQRGIPRVLILAVLVYAGGYVWYVLMPAQCVDHAGLSFLQVLIVPGTALALTVPFEVLARLADKIKLPLVRALVAWTLPAAFAVISICSSELPLTADKWAFEREFDKVAVSLRELQGRVNPDQYAACNVFRPTMMMSYYIGARVRPVETATEFDSLPAKPELFLLVPVNHPETQQLLQRLQAGYAQAGIADNRRLPFYIFRKKPDPPTAPPAPGSPPPS